MPWMHGHTRLVSRGIVHIMGAEAITVSVPEMIEASARHVNFYGDASPYYLELPAV
jgi:hypothetical protein